MNLRVLPLTARELPLCERLWPDRVAYTDAEFAQAMNTVGTLVSEGRLGGRVVMQGEQLRAYGISTFVREEFADAYLTRPHPQLAKRLLLERPPRTILSLEEIAHGNTRGGLELVIPSANHDTTPDEPAVLGAMMGAFLDAHRGYRIKRVIKEAVGEPDIATVSQGDSAVVRIFDRIAADVSIRSVVVTLNRDYAAARKSPFLTLFVYTPPRVLFTPSEQELLLAALDGAPDDLISERLGLAVSSVKARWNRIHQRVAERLPDLVEHANAPGNPGYRGRQIRHVVLQYVRDNPSELTPYARAARQRALNEAAD